MAAAVVPLVCSILCLIGWATFAIYFTLSDGANFSYMDANYQAWFCLLWVGVALSLALILVSLKHYMALMKNRSAVYGGDEGNIVV